MKRAHPLIAAVAGLATAAALATAATPAAADTPQPPTVSVTGHGSIAYTPDIARAMLGVRAEALTASAAAASVNMRARAVINAMRALGIDEKDLKTAGYNIYYQPPPQPDNSASQPPPEAAAMPAPAPAPAPGTVQTQSIARKPMPPLGKYIASETILVKSTISLASKVLDAGLRAGADETYGLTFDTSMRDALYRQALAKAVEDARAQADILSSAAGTAIDGVQSIAAEAPGMPVPMMRAAAMGPTEGPPIAGGTDSVDAAVDIVYRLKP